MHMGYSLVSMVTYPPPANPSALPLQTRRLTFVKLPVLDVWYDHSVTNTPTMAGPKGLGPFTMLEIWELHTGEFSLDVISLVFTVVVAALFGRAMIFRIASRWLPGRTTAGRGFEIG